MKPSDLTPNKIEEAPQGWLNRLGNKAAVKFLPKTDFGLRAAGNLNTGAVANQAWASYQQYLGQTEGLNAKPTKKSVLAWLKWKKYSPNAIKAAEQVIDKHESEITQAAKNAEYNTYESKKPAHHLDMMRSYLDILSEKTIAEAASPAAGSLAQGLTPGMAMNTLRPSIAGGGTRHSATPNNPNQEPAAAPTAAPAAALQASPAAVSTGVLTSKAASQAIMAASQAQSAEQYNEPQAAPQQAPAAVSDTGAGAAGTAQAGIGGGNTATTVDQLYNKGGTKSATDPYTMASELANTLRPSIGSDREAASVVAALDKYTERAAAPELKAAAESLNFSESFNPGKMLQKKVTKLTRIK